MKVVKTISKISSFIRAQKRAGLSVGFVPTMGYLHEGHLSLIRKAREDNDVVVVSIFVNPAQFGPGEDYKKYPRKLNRDTKLAKSAGCGIIFCPSTKVMYPEGYQTHVEVSDLTSGLCGISRPEHFKGVATVCTKLFNIVRPDIAYFGQKDYQQALIIRRMVDDLNMGLKIRVLPIVREDSGLAMSSRNKYLSNKERQDAAIIHRSLKEAKALIQSGERISSKIKSAIARNINSKDGFLTEYVALVDPDTLEERKRISSKVLIAVAVKVGRTRLIDNIIVNSSK
ncbi:pantoate--beta-alanine ligase [Candidatus Omnitrophota bacterium]